MTKVNVPLNFKTPGRPKPSTPTHPTPPTEQDPLKQALGMTYRDACEIVLGFAVVSLEVLQGKRAGHPLKTPDPNLLLAINRVGKKTIGPDFVYPADATKPDPTTTPQEPKP